MRLTGLRVAVTGASGFCGAAVATAAAERGADVICLARRPGPAGRHVRWDAARETPDLTGADVIIHLAAAVGDPRLRPAAEREFRAVNVDGAERLLAAANGRPVVWVSSASVYDPRVSRRRVREDHPMAAQLNAYGRSKAAATGSPRRTARWCCGRTPSTARAIRTCSPGCGVASARECSRCPARTCGPA